MTIRFMTFIASLPVLWSGRLVLRAPTARQDAAIAAYALLLSLWLVLLSTLLPVERLSQWRMRWLTIGVVSGVLLFALGGLGYAFSHRVLGFAPPEETTLIERSVGLRFCLLLAAALCAAFVEEWVFRGWLFDAFGSWPTWAAVIASSIMFAAYHLSAFQFVPTLLLGIGLGALVLQAGSLWPAVIAHGVFNLLGLLLTTLGPRIQPGG